MSGQEEKSVSIELKDSQADRLVQIIYTAPISRAESDDLWRTITMQLAAEDKRRQEEANATDNEPEKHSKN